MQYLNAKVTESLGFFYNTNPFDLVEKYGSPLYVYNESILLDRIRKMKNLVSYENFNVYFSAKANSNLAILQIACKEGMNVDAMSPGEIFVQLEAGFTPDKIFYVCNNVSKDEMRYAIEKGVIVSVDSVSQLEQFATVNPHGRVALRFNGGIGAGHHEKVVTAGKNTKFGINPEYIADCKRIINGYGLKLVGINQHIGSLFLEPDGYVEGAKSLLSIAKQFDDLEFVDFGGGFGIPYNKQDDGKALDLDELGKRLDEVFENFVKEYGKRIMLNIEPGRYISAECGVLLGTVHSIKLNNKKYIGTDLGFNVLMRPVLYDSHHDIEVYRKFGINSVTKETVTIVGNICESGDIIAKDITLPVIFEGDILGVLDAGSYGHVMSSNYNNRLRPAEILIRENGEIVQIRKRDALEDLLSHYVKI